MEGGKYADGEGGGGEERGRDRTMLSLFREFRWNEHSAIIVLRIFNLTFSFDIIEFHRIIAKYDEIINIHQPPAFL